MIEPSIFSFMLTFLHCLKLVSTVHYWKLVIQGSHMVSGTRCPALLLFQDSEVGAGQRPQRADVL